MSNCSWCQKDFEISPEERELRVSLSPVIAGVTYALPDPKLCPDCRMQRRMAFRNERRLFRRTAASGVPILSMYREGTPFPVMENKTWWSDENDPLQYGRDIDWNRPFFEQMAELVRVVPRLQYFKASEERMQNSDYTNCVSDLKDCYLVFAGNNNEKCSYCDYSNLSYNCIDCYFCQTCTECYECIDCDNCSRLVSSQNCKTCSDSYFLYDCRDVQNSIGCVGLRSKSYHILNKEVTKEEFEATLAQLKQGNRDVYTQLAAAFEQLKATKPKKFIQGEGNEAVTGNVLFNAKECTHCFDITNCERMMFATFMMDSKDCMDYYAWGEDSNQMYEAVGTGEKAYGSQFISHSFGVKECQYLDLCMYTSNCFGCVGLKKNQYCILNKQYTKEEYEALVPRLIEHMKTTGEWGEFFPVSLSSFPYVDSVANYFYPMTAAEVGERGWQVVEEMALNAQGGEVPNTPIAAYADPTKAAELLPQVFACAATGQGFKITSLELSYLLKMGLPLPDKSPETRFRERLKKRNPRKLWDRPCDKCGSALKTSFDPAKGDTVYCEACYQASIL